MAKRTFVLSAECPASQDINDWETEATNDPPICSEMEWEEPTNIIPVEEMDIRLKYIRKIEKWLQKSRATVGGFCYLYDSEVGLSQEYKIEQLDRAVAAWLLVADLSFLEESAERADTYPGGPGPNYILEHARSLRRMMKVFFSRDIFTPWDQHQSDKQETGVIHGTRCFERCHIIVRKMSLLNIPYISLLINEDQHKRQDLKLAAKIGFMFGGESGISDRPWNQIRLDKALSMLWGELRFGLKFLDVDLDRIDKPLSYDTVVRLKLQFHWMPRRKDVSFWKPENRTKEAILEQFDGTWGDDGNHGLNGRVPKSGDIIWVPVKYRDWELMKFAIGIRWALTQIAAIAGIGPSPTPETHCGNPRTSRPGHQACDTPSGQESRQPTSSGASTNTTLREGRLCQWGPSIMPGMHTVPYEGETASCEGETSVCSGGYPILPTAEERKQGRNRGGRRKARTSHL